MPAFSASAPGKVIIFGEHAVVYGHPAIAVPVFKVRSKAYITANPLGVSDQIYIEAPDIDLFSDINDLPYDNPIKALIIEVKKFLGIDSLPSFNLRIKSTIPIAAGLGSGASISISIAKAIFNFIGIPINAKDVSSIAFQIEKLHHGTPSGIDNTVITYEKPIFFRKDKPFEIISIKNPFNLIIADSGIKSYTSEVVGELRDRRNKNPESINKYLSLIGNITEHGRDCLSKGNFPEMGKLMNKNHEILRDIGISNKKLDMLVKTAIKNGALGAKLSGAGQGGNIIALVNQDQSIAISQNLIEAGASNTIITEINSG